MNHWSQVLIKCHRYITRKHFRANLVRMTLLWGIMCIFVACSPAESGPAEANLVVTVAPAHADIDISGDLIVTQLAEKTTSLQATTALNSSYLAESGSFYTVSIDAEGHSSFEKKYWLREGKRLNIDIGLAAKGGVLPEGKYAEAFEAEAAKVDGGFERKDDDENASGSGYLTQAKSASATSSAREDGIISFRVPSSDSYTLWARMYAPSDTGDAAYLGFNGALERIHPDKKGEYVWVKAAEAALESGANRISLGHAEAGARLDLLIVTNKNLSEKALRKFVTVVKTEETEATSPSDIGLPLSSGVYGLRGDPNFSEEQLSTEQRKWYDRLWAAIDNPDQFPDIMGNVENDDIYQFGRNFYTYNQTLLFAFRMTGDLKLLDEVDKAAQGMRGELSDSWCASDPYTDSSLGKVSGKDGYLNWRYRYRDGGGFDRYYCRDTIVLEEKLTHGHVALLMYAFHANRNLKSPSGVNYGERADFWLDYLRNHYEAKWRDRNNTPWPAMDFLEFNTTHTHMQTLLYFYYVGKRLMEDGDRDGEVYLKEAQKRTEQMFTEPFIPSGSNAQAGGFQEVDTPLGKAFVYAFGTPYGSTDITLMATPTTYARYAVAAMLELHFEEFSRWDEMSMAKVANGIAHFVMDKDKLEGVEEPFAKDVTGGRGAAGIPATTYRGRLDTNKYALSSFAMLSPWERSGHIEDINTQAYDITESDANSPVRVVLPAAMFISEVLKNGF